MSTVYNWGIIGCGKCASAFAPVLQQLYKRSNLVACGARTLSKAQHFAKKFGIPQNHAYDSYEAVSSNPNVDIVYIATINSSHYTTVINALNNKKHVLCEKPIAINYIQTKQMVETARRNKRFLMEAMWTRFFPAYRKVRKLINNDSIGTVISFYGDFGREITKTDAPRLYNNKLGGGSVLDLGCYVINPLSMLFGCKMPSKIKAVGIIDKESNVDICCSASVVYDDTKQFAQFSCSVCSHTFEEWHIIGHKGRIKIESPGHRPTKIVLYKDGNERQFEFKWPVAPDNFSGKECFVYEIEVVTKCIDDGLLQSSEYTWDEMMISMKIMDEVRRQIGVSYEQDGKLKDVNYNKLFVSIFVIGVVILALLIKVFQS